MALCRYYSSHLVLSLNCSNWCLVRGRCGQTNSHLELSHISMWTDGEGQHRYQRFSSARVTALKTHASAPSQWKQSNTQTINKIRNDSLRNNEAICNFPWEVLKGQFIIREARIPDIKHRMNFFYGVSL